MEITNEQKQYLISFGLHLKKLREERNLSFEEISLRTGIRPQYLKRIENGTAYGVLIDKHLSKIANALHVKISEMFNF